MILLNKLYWFYNCIISHGFYTKGIRAMNFLTHYLVSLANKKKTSKCRKTIAVLMCTFVLTLLSLPSHAGLISFNGFTHDTSTDVVTGHGLEWLQWDLTIGRSISWAEGGGADLLGYGTGWDVATGQQVTDLFNAFFGANSFSDLEGISQSISTGVDVGTEGGADLTFISMFGDTYAAAGLSFDEGEGGFQRSSALFGEDANKDSLFMLASVHDDYGSGGSAFTGKAEFLWSPSYTETWASGQQGIVLVRSASSTSVPEPNTLMLFLLLPFVFLANRKRAN